MRRRHWMLTAAGLIFVASAVVLAALRPWSTTRASEHPAPAVHPPLSEARGQTITADLAAGTASALQDAVILPSSQPLDPAALSGLAALRLDVEVSSFALSKDASDVATVKVATGAGTSAHSWRATLIFTTGEWKIATTGPAR